MLRFDWDERKNRANRTKHGVWFEEAQSVFDDPLLVVHCYSESEELFRIISARKGQQEGGENL